VQRAKPFAGVWGVPTSLSSLSRQGLYESKTRIVYDQYGEIPGDSGFSISYCGIDAKKTRTKETLLLLMLPVAKIAYREETYR